MSDPSTDPVGPSGWSLANWIGFTLQLTLLVGGALLLYWIGRRPPDE